MKNTFITIISALALVCLASCLTNDIPYPHIQANFTSISAFGQTRPADIDTINRSVTFYLPEQVDISNVVIDSYTLAEGVTLVGDTLLEPLNLTNPVTVTLHKYQDYQWTLNAQQTITRYCALEGQIGVSTIDVPARRVVANIPDSYDLTNVLVDSIKLGPDGSTMSPDLNGKRVDFTNPVEVSVNSYGRVQTWTIYVEAIAAKVFTTEAIGWTNVGWVYGECQAGLEPGVEYRIVGDNMWSQVPKEWLTVEGGSFYARILHLSPATTYEARAFVDGEAGVTMTFTTGLAPQLPNGNFEYWWQDGKVWCPWAQDGEKFWDSGNIGATTLGSSNTMPTDDTPTGTGLAALLKSEYKGFRPLGKLAAGNIFIGSYVRTDGTNGILSFGRSWTDRPTKLRGYLKYTTAPITDTSTGFEDLKGRPDTCVVWIALIDSPEPFEIRTRPTNRQLFNPDAEDVVAYGIYQSGQTIENYIPFEIQLDYRYTNRIPRYILVTASASKYGDYFTGAVGATMWLDDLELVYDY